VTTKYTAHINQTAHLAFIGDFGIRKLSMQFEW